MWTSDRILSRRDWLEVRGPNASLVLAEMVEHEVAGDRTDEQLIDHSMRLSHARCAPDLSIAVARVGTGPFPAAIADQHLVAEGEEQVLSMCAQSASSGRFQWLYKTVEQVCSTHSDDDAGPESASHGVLLRLRSREGFDC